jgi:hypothetical protein
LQFYQTDAHCYSQLVALIQQLEGPELVLVRNFSTLLFKEVITATKEQAKRPGLRFI